MKNSFDTLLNELYELDGSLRENEAELRRVIETMLQSKPDTEFSTEFYEDLRARLTQRIRQMGAEADSSSSHISFFSFLRPWGLVAAAFVLGLLPSAYLFLKNTSSIFPAPLPQSAVESQKNSPDFAPEIIAKEKDAFGPNLINLQAPDQKILGMGGGGDTSAARLAPTNVVNYEYIYEGNLPLPDSPTLPVYKRVTHENIGNGFADALKNIGMGIFDPSTFPNLAFQNVALSQDVPFGYTLNADFVTEQISLSPNFQKWPNPLQKCFGEGVALEASQKCQEENSLKKTDIPDDAEMINAAENFLSEHGVDISRYGKPYVNNDWKVEYERVSAETAGSSLVLPLPEQIPVVFPLLVEGKTVFDETRGEYGINVAYDIRNKRIASVFNLTTERYEKSEYDIQNDQAQLKQMLSRGGLFNSFVPAGGSTKQIRLENPEIAFIRHTDFKDEKMEELIIPVLLFHIPPQEGANMLLPDKVVVPLIKGIEFNNPQMMPLTDEVPIKPQR